MDNDRNKLLQDLQKAQMAYAKELGGHVIQKDPNLLISAVCSHSSQLAKMDGQEHEAMQHESGPNL